MSVPETRDLRIKFHFARTVLFPAWERTCVQVAGGILRNSSTI